jgi:hypothetical protein
VVALGSTIGLALTYQWYRDGNSITDRGNITVVNSNALTIASVSSADSGTYHVAVLNAAGAETSAGAVLLVRDPAILAQPANQTNSVGGGVSFSVPAVGTEPVAYRWR